MSYICAHWRGWEDIDIILDNFAVVSIYPRNDNYYVLLQINVNRQYINNDQIWMPLVVTFNSTCRSELGLNYI